MDRLAVKWFEKGPHGRLLDMSDDEFETWNPEGRAGHLYMLRGALGQDVPGESLCYQGSNGTGYLTMFFQTEGNLTSGTVCTIWNDLAVMAPVSNPWLSYRSSPSE